MKANKLIRSLVVGISGIVMLATSSLPAFAVSDSRYICSGSPIPAGYVITMRYNYWDCKGNFDIHNPNAAVIMRLDPSDTNVTVCSNSPIPSGWTISKTYTNNYCGTLLTPRGTYDAYNAYIIVRTRDTGPASKPDNVYYIPPSFVRPSTTSTNRIDPRSPEGVQRRLGR